MGLDGGDAVQNTSTDPLNIQPGVTPRNVVPKQLLHFDDLENKVPQVVRPPRMPITEGIVGIH
jgi:hypothetical protein